uniref:Uncharacterized protein n=1 Tax=Physcomitrium patens TaxID=3218 RepID=A0A2K1ISN9_PHYPA|nr:hypothetical protein PHYPA_026419 [Physcomitrium patens]
MEVLCLQEHKLRGRKLSELGPKIWRHTTFFSCEASPGYNQVDGQDGTGGGRICMFISPRIHHLIVSHRIVGANMAQWVIFRGYQGGDVAVLNVYTPHTSQEQILPWQELLRLQGCYWVVCSDRIMVEAARIKSSTCDKLLSGREKEEFHLLKSHL